MHQTIRKYDNSVRNSAGQNLTHQKRPPRVAVLVDTATGWGRRLIEGVQRYCLRTQHWQLLVEPRGRDELLDLPKALDCNGIIARIANERISQKLQQKGVPLVNISRIKLDNLAIPRVYGDVDAEADIVADYFVQRGFRYFAYSQVDRKPHVAYHSIAFNQAVKSHQFECIIDKKHASRNSSNDMHFLESLAQWLKELPKPVAVYSWGTQRSRELIDACELANLVVPHDVSIMAGDYDEVLCEVCHPTISGVLTPSEQIGFHAAKLLANMMVSNQATSSSEILLPPAGIIENMSTNTLAVEDIDMRTAMSFIDNHACEMITTDDVLSHVSMGKRTFEKRFKLTFGRSPAEEIRNRRIARAKELLVNTDQSTTEIAHACGFSSHAYLSFAFSRENHMSPSEYRNKMKTQS